MQVLTGRVIQRPFWSKDSKVFTENDIRTAFNHEFYPLLHTPPEFSHPSQQETYPTAD